MKGRNDSLYKQFEIPAETIEQELRPVVYEQQQTDRFKENYSISTLEKTVRMSTFIPV